MHVGPFVLAKVQPTNEHHDNMFGGIIITAHFSKNYIHNGKKHESKGINGTGLRYGAIVL